MPYVGEEKEEAIASGIEKCTSVGDYNAAFTVAYLSEFIKEPRYATIHNIRKASINPSVLSSVALIDEKLMGLGVPSLDLIVARELAFDEFYVRIGHPYENLARTKNGDLALYKEAEKVLHEIAVKLVIERTGGHHE